MKTHAEEKKANADCVLFESPAITFFKDAAALAATVDGLIPVVESEKGRCEVSENPPQVH